jgi:hypothetical protein
MIYLTKSVSSLAGFLEGFLIFGTACRLLAAAGVTARKLGTKPGQLHHMGCQSVIIQLGRLFVMTCGISGSQEGLAGGLTD